MAKTYEIKIGSTDISELLKPGGYKVTPSKLYSDANRTLGGELKATFIGIFPKIELEFRAMSEAEAKALLALLSPASISCNYWDSESGTYKTQDFYTGDFTYELYLRELELYNSFSVSLVPFKKRT
jgi:hypothetical protein